MSNDKPESGRLALTTRQAQNFPLKKTEQLPIWPEPVRGGPNALLRSAFFAGIHSKKRQILGVQTRPEKKPEGVMIAAQDGISIKFAGTQLNQYDADVFFEALHRARRHPLDTECSFKGSPFLNAIGRSDSTLNYEDLDESLDRLRRGTVEIEWKTNGQHYIFSGSLIASYVRETTTKFYKVTFAKEIRVLFSSASWTQLEWDERKALKGKPLAQWLHSYFSTHAAPFPVSVAFLHEKTGSPTKRRAHFKSELQNALDALQSALGWTHSWQKDLVTVVRPPSASQSRHLSRRVTKAAKTKQARQTTLQGAPKRGGDMTSIADLLPGLMKSVHGTE